MAGGRRLSVSREGLAKRVWLTMFVMRVAWRVSSDTPCHKVAFSCGLRF
jgi:hypothetical protein